jgi:hypothetical protein
MSTLPGTADENGRRQYAARSAQPDAAARVA